MNKTVNELLYGESMVFGDIYILKRIHILQPIKRLSFFGNHNNTPAP